MYFIKPEDRAVYLIDLSRKLSEVENPEWKLSDVIASLAAHQEWIREKNKTVARFPVEVSGFPSAPTLGQDIKFLYQESVSYEKKAKKAIESLKKGATKPSQKNELERGFIHAQSSIFEPYIKPSSIDNSDKLVKYIIQENDGWFEIFSKSEDAEKLRKKQLHNVIIDNSDEVGVLGISMAAGSLIFWPLILAYPGLLLLKSAKQSEKNKKNTFLVGDIIRYFKHRKDDESEITSGERSNVDSFKYFNPLTDGKFEYPVLVRKRKGNVKIVCSNQELKATLDGVCYSNANLNNLLTMFTYSKDTGDTNTNVNAASSEFKPEDLISFLKSIKDHGKKDVKGELHELTEEEKTNLETILSKECDNKIFMPEKVYVDRLGTLYPTPILWYNHDSGSDELNKKTVTKLALDYLLNGEAGIPLAQFIHNMEELDRLNYFLGEWDTRGDTFRQKGVSETLQRLNQGYVFVSKKQLSLKEPNAVRSKIKITKSLSQRKGRMYEKLKEASKKDVHFNRALNNVNIFLPNGNVVGSLQEMFELKKEVDKKVESLETDFKEGKLKGKDQIYKEFIKASEEKSKFERKYSKAVLNLGSQLIKVFGEKSPEEDKDEWE